MWENWGSGCYSNRWVYMEYLCLVAIFHHNSPVVAMLMCDGVHGGHREFIDVHRTAGLFIH
ncbi:hypothetical protein CFELI_05240 [Corynebacterium felinum]|uniref:Uncharacterized protein n=1 Tax=Corynebacterium felinum TaxID=131318 RepID=A0ABU2B9N5_9CORY|nr:hypothetical protein [Corynebacterium felinum]WJY94676.1 hypothetical protein CFELI_05240 [Corynebacterium felinum]